MQALNAALKDNVVPGLSQSFSLVRHHTARLVAAGIAAATSTAPAPTLPAAGLDIAASQQIWCTLLQAAHDAKDSPMHDALALQHWLQALRASQAASDRLLLDLHRVQSNLHFWQHQLRDGSEGTHFRFLLLARGPMAFLHDVTSFVQQLWGQPQPSQSRGAWDQPLSATNQIQHRVLVLQAIQRRLVTALAQVHHAASHLGLDAALCFSSQPPLPQGTGHQQPAPAAMGAAILQQASAAAYCCAVELRQAIDKLHGGMQEWLAQFKPQDQEQHAAAASPSARPWHMDMLLQLLSEPGHEDQGPLTPPATRPTFGIAACEDGTIVDTLLGEAERAQEGVKTTAAEQQAAAAAAAVDSVAGYLCAARRGAAAAPPLVRLPAWLRMPSRLQRHWLLYCLRGAGAAWVLHFLYRHSRLAGSADLELWAGGAAQAVAQAWVAHVAQPLANVRAELFHTFRDRPCIVSQEEFRADEQSLLRMLDAFARDKGVSGTTTASSPPPPPPPSGGPRIDPSPGSLGGTAAGVSGTGAASSGEQSPSPAPLHQASSTTAAGSGMQLVMLSYEAELRSPLRNLLIGDLARAMLIQVQRLKLDTEAAMLQLDQILRASELSISLMAALPALLVSWGLLAGAAGWLRPRAPDVKHKAVPLRMAAAELQRSMQGLIRLRRRQEQQEPDVAAAQGMVLYNLAVVHREAVRLYRHYDRTSRYSEYPHLMADLHELAALMAGGEEAGMAGQALDRILRTHRAFQHA